MKKEFIKETEIQNPEPHSGHRERFLKRLEKEGREEEPKKSFRIPPFLIGLYSAAAVAVLVVMFLPKTNPDNSAEVVKPFMTPKLEMTAQTEKLELIYAQHVAPQIPKIREALPELETQIELLEILENEYDKLKELLLKSNGNTAVTQEMLRNHKLRLNLMEQIVKQIEFSKNSKKQQNELQTI